MYCLDFKDDSQVITKLKERFPGYFEYPPILDSTQREISKKRKLSQLEKEPAKSIEDIVSMQYKITKEILGE
jgi:hypothetical protein